MRLVDGRAERLPADDASVDAAVVSLVLCSVEDVDRALAEIRRVLLPAGELRFYEHVRAETPALARGQRALDLVWPRFVGGCHTSRETLAAIERAGFTIERVRRFRFLPTPLALPVAPHIVGVARSA